MSKFNVGDKVRITESTIWYNKGEYGVIERINNNDNDAYVKFETERQGAYSWYVNFEEMEPYSEGPIRTVMRREIVNGTYGRIKVFNGVAGQAIDFTGSRYFTPEELREAAHILNQLAEALEDA